jgi:tetratricopeptide (TPR) repeat protein
VATILEPSKLWSHLSSNFSAWSLFEKAEDFSRAENCFKSIETFKEAAELFEEAKEAFDHRINRIENPDEKEKAIELSKASLYRKEYCVARADVEEAKIADRKGDHAESAAKYESAANAFERMLEKVNEKEIAQIACMCKAWQKKEMGDSRISPELYREASELFLKAKEYSIKDKTALLASGNSAFCKALEHGIRFEATREKDDFLKTKQHLENAANCYLKAGFDSASTWTSATEMFFDADIYIISAEAEVDPNKKTKAYLLVEKCLERSANLFEKAGYSGRKDEVLRTLAKVREKREFAVSLEQLLTVPADASSTRMVTPPGMTLEEPIGLSKFEQAFVQANLGVHPKELAAGEEFALEIQLVNLGKKPASLIDIEQLIPDGFDLVATPEKGVVINSSLNLKGKKLGPLETAEMKLTLKPKKKGSFIFKPKVKYMDETGEHKSFEPDLVAVTVKELGIRGWLKGQA